MIPNEDKCSERFEVDGQTLLCQKTIGHSGWHESGDHEWMNARTVASNSRKVSDEYEQGKCDAADFIERQALANFMPNSPEMLLLRGIALCIRKNMTLSGTTQGAPSASERAAPLALDELRELSAKWPHDDDECDCRKCELDTALAKLTAAQAGTPGGSA